ncbi:MAG: Crp/Fnr family transcriptional regulator [Chloroflexi bacterium]|nr:Crp/Fnr family transcriptional regulator [Chloroflexota bacterium]
MPKPPTPDEVHAIPHLAAIPRVEAERLARVIEVRAYGPRALVLAEGDPCHGFFVLRSGRARIFRTGFDGREQILRLLGPGDSFGEVPVFDGGPNPATVEAIDPSEALFIPAATFIDVMERYPAVARALLRHLARRLRAFTDLVEQISLQTVQNRVARYLYLSAREEGVPTAEGIVVPRTITQQDLAALVGSVREVVSRTLRVLEDDGLVEVRRREFLVRDLDALRKMI